MGIKRVWREVSTGWVVEYPDCNKEPVHVFPKQCRITSGCCASELVLPQAHIQNSHFSYSERPLILKFVSQEDMSVYGPNVGSSPPPYYADCYQCGPPRDWKPYMNNTQTRNWLTEHFYAALRIYNLAAAVQLANCYRYGDGDTLNNMKFEDMKDINGINWAHIVWRALGKSEISPIGR